MNAVVSGSIVLGLCLFRFFYPDLTKAGLTAFPRNTWAGRLFAAIDIALVAHLLLSEGFSWVDAHRPLVLVAAPIAYIIVVMAMDELLAVRALGGLLLLIPYGILNAAFNHTAPSKLVMTLFAYLLAIAGMVLVWSPYLFRKFARRVTDGSPFGMAAGVAGSLLGLAMIILGLVVY